MRFTGRDRPWHSEPPVGDPSRGLGAALFEEMLHRLHADLALLNEMDAGPSSPPVSSGPITQSESAAADGKAT